MTSTYATYQALRRTQVSRATATNETFAGRKWCSWFDAKRLVPGSLRPEHFEEFLFGPGGLSTQVAPNTFNTQMNQVRAYLNWGSARGLWPGNVCSMSRTLRTMDRDRSRLRPDELQAIVLGCVDPWVRITLALGIHCLARDSELRSLRLGDVDLQAGTIRWTNHKSQKQDRKPITLELDRELRTWLTLYPRLPGVEGGLRDEWYLIPRRSYQWRFTYHPALPCYRLARVVHSELAKYLPGGDTKMEGIHTLRRSAARALFEALAGQGRDNALRVVQSSLGHSSVTITEKYIGASQAKEERDDLMRGHSFLAPAGAGFSQLRVVANG
jgi:integrase